MCKLERFNAYEVFHLILLVLLKFDHKSMKDHQSFQLLHVAVDLENIYTRRRIGPSDETKCRVTYTFSATAVWGGWLFSSQLEKDVIA